MYPVWDKGRVGKLSCLQLFSIAWRNWAHAQCLPGLDPYFFIVLSDTLAACSFPSAFGQSVWCCHSRWQAWWWWWQTVAQPPGDQLFNSSCPLICQCPQLGRSDKSHLPTPSLARLFGCFPVATPGATQRKSGIGWRSEHHWAREAAKQAAHTCHLLPLALYIATGVVCELRDATRQSVHWSSHQQHLPGRVGCQCLPHSLPGPAVSCLLASLSPPQESATTGGRQADKQEST